jgi:hypothetical protein
MPVGRVEVGIRSSITFVWSNSMTITFENQHQDTTRHNLEPSNSYSFFLHISVHDFHNPGTAKQRRLPTSFQWLRGTPPLPTSSMYMPAELPPIARYDASSNLIGSGTLIKAESREACLDMLTSRPCARLAIHTIP